MKTRDIKLARIGNSRGIRIPAETLKRYDIHDALTMEELADGILLRPSAASQRKLTWAETATQMATDEESWQDWDNTSADGLDSVPWSPTPNAVKEAHSGYQIPLPPPKRYAIYWAALDPTEGAEMAKTRPVVVVSLDALNERLKTVTVCPLTTSLHPLWRSRLQIECDGTTCEIVVDQIRTISRARLRDKLDDLPETRAKSLRRLITEMYGE